MSIEQRPYEFVENTTTLCPECFMRLDGKMVEKEGRMHILRHCPKHGEQEDLLEEDAQYFRRRMLFNKPGSVSKIQTVRNRGCPFDCGLCPEHEQHSCIGLIEVTDACDLKCPMCYANSGFGRPLPLKTIEKMLDFFVDSECGEAEILQISGGEPTTHPEILDIIRRAREKNIKYIMLNTNGLRIAEDEAFADELAKFVGGFEIYLQFDGFETNTYKHLRGRDLLATKKRAIENLCSRKIPITLVSTIERGINDDEVGRIVEFGLNTPHIRGINFQPVAFFGRLRKGQIRKDRSTVTGIIEGIHRQTSGTVSKEDFFPLPCNVDRVSIAYLYRTKEGFVPLTRSMNVSEYLPVIRNTFKFDPEDFLKDLTKKSLCSDGSCCDYSALLKNFKKFLPKNYFLKSKKEKIAFISENVFRISATSFLDAYNFDMKSMKKECVHVITPDLKKIPFSAFNMIHRKKIGI